MYKSIYRESRNFIIAPMTVSFLGKLT